MYSPKEPVFVNDLGVKWWLDDLLTDYAIRPGKIDVTLDAICYAIELTEHDYWYPIINKLLRTVKHLTEWCAVSTV